MSIPHRRGGEKGEFSKTKISTYLFWVMPLPRASGKVEALVNGKFRAQAMLSKLLTILLLPLVLVLAIVADILGLEIAGG